MTTGTAAAAADARTIALSLISHTNVGKTTLARTLLARDIGEVRDAAHVTDEAERHTLISSPEGDRLELWDTPGLGDSVRLAKRLEREGSALGWFLNEVWDRFRDRPFWSSQRALRNVLNDADLVLYLVNAAEAPEDIGYLDAELRVMDLLGKPVIVLLNQMGPPKPPEQEAAEVERWRRRITERPTQCVRDVIALDAFARCWVQEDTLLAAVGNALPQDHQAAIGRLRAAWRKRSRETFDAAMQVLAENLARAALDREIVRTEGWSGRLKEIGVGIGTLLGLRRDGTPSPREVAMEALADRLDGGIRASTERLIRVHGLEGEATGIVLARLAEHYAVREPVSEGKAAVLGGVVTGALAGLKADLATGGLTLGGGLLAGGVLGALGAAGLTRGFNVVRGVDKPTLSWSDPVLDQLVRSALLGYLTVAHYGRGRGHWTESEHPPFWKDAVNELVERDRDRLQKLWAMRAGSLGRPTERTSTELVAALRSWLAEATETLLRRLYPAAAGWSAAEPARATG